MRFPGFASGLWIPDGANMAAPPDALIVAKNVEYLPTGGVRGRRGREKYNASALGGSVKSLWRHYPRSGTPSTLAAVDIGASYSMFKSDGTSGTFSSLATGFADDKPWYFANWASQNRTYAANGDAEMKYYDGSSFSDVAAGTAKKGPYVTVHKSRLWATAPTEINYSVYASDINTPGTWGAAGSQLSVNEPQGGSITGLASYNGMLLIAKTTAWFRFLGDIGAPGELVNYSQRGCVAPRTLAVTPYGVIYLAQDGLYVTDGVDPAGIELSRPIRTLFVTRGSNLTYPSAIGAWNETKQQYYLRLDPASTDLYVLSKVDFVMETPGGASVSTAWIWSLFTSHPATALAPWASESDTGEMIYGDADGYVWYMGRGVTDGGTAYETMIRTASRLMDGARRMGRAQRVKALYRGSGVLTGTIYYDNDSTGTAFTV